MAAKPTKKTSAASRGKSRAQTSGKAVAKMPAKAVVTVADKPLVVVTKTTQETIIVKAKSAAARRERRAVPRNDPAAAERLAAQVEDIVVVGREPAARGHEWRRLDTGLLDDVKSWVWDRGVVRALGQGKGDMAAVKEGVMAELRNMRQDTAGATGRVTSTPFSGVLLPERAKPRRKDAWKWFAGMSVALIVLLLWLGGRTPEGPEKAVAGALAAARGGNAEKLREFVDVQALGTDVVDQVMAAPQMDVAALPDALQNALQRDLKARMEAMIKPGLADKMAEQFGQLTREKRWPVPADGLLYQVWEDLGGSSIDVGKPLVVGESDHAAIVALPVNGADMTGVLEVKLARGEDGRWRVVGVPNLSQVLLARDVERATQVEVVGAAVVALSGSQQAAAVQAASATPPLAVAGIGRELETPDEVVTIRDVIKGKQGNDTLMIRAVVVNNSGVRVSHVNWAVLFADAAGVPMLEVPLELDEALMPGMQVEQVWNVPLDQGNPKARYVRDLPQGALKVSARVVRVVGP